MRKLERIVALILVLIIVIFTNVMDNTSFRIVKESIGNIYEDRLVAYDLTYRMHHEVEERRLMLLKGDLTGFGNSKKQFNIVIDSLLTQYAITELTNNEAEYFATLKKQLTELQQMENAFNTQDNPEELGFREKIEAKSAKIVDSLNALAAIQVSEGKRQLDISKRAFESSYALSKVEIISMIVITILIIFLIIYEPKV